LKQPLGVYAKMEWVSLKHLTKSNGVVFPAEEEEGMLISQEYSDGYSEKITAENVIARQEGDFP
jgi:DNA-directed RNA polymerase subunit beta